MEYYSVIKKDKVMLFAATGMGLEIIMLSEVSQTEKDKYKVLCISVLSVVISPFSFLILLI